MKKMIALLVLFALAATLTAASAETFYARQVANCNEYVTLRKSPSGSAAELDRVYVGDVVMAAPYNSEFSYCCYNSQYGYIKSRYLSSYIEPWSEGSFRVAHCNSYISLRAMPITSAKVLAKVPLGTKIEAIYYHDGGIDDSDFAYIRYNGQYGWVLWRYLEYISVWGGQ